MLGILGAKEGALMVIEPPGYVRMGGIFEINDNVRITVEKAVFKQLVCPMSESRILELGAAIEFAVQKTGHKRRRCCPVKAVVVVQDAHLHRECMISENLLDCLTTGRNASDK